MTMRITREYHVVDVFADVPLQGNPVAVFTDGGGLSSEVMQRTARELNLSETVFVTAGRDGADACVRIFTPAIELPFAGHPILGTAVVLRPSIGADQMGLLTGVGVVTVTLQREDGHVVAGEMEQPVPTWAPLPAADAVLAALGISGSALPVEVYDNGPRHAFVALRDVAQVVHLRPDMAALQDAGEFGVSCFALDGDRRVKTRMFAPALGVAEDPATGSAAGPLAVHLARHGWTRFGERITISQGAEVGRPSVLRAVAHGCAERLERVLVAGKAVIVARGEYRLQ